MPNAVWPGTLPQDVEIDGYEESFGAGKVRTQMDAGPAKQRPRFTAVVKPLTFTMHFTRAQVAILETFHDDTLALGSLKFDFTHPRTLVTKTFRFVSEPKPRPLSGNVWIAQMQWEMMP
jgi:hypothetical protein